MNPYPPYPPYQSGPPGPPGMSGGSGYNSGGYNPGGPPHPSRSGPPPPPLARDPYPPPSYDQRGPPPPSQPYYRDSRDSRDSRDTRGGGGYRDQRGGEREPYDSRRDSGPPGSYGGYGQSSAGASRGPPPPQHGGAPRDDYYGRNGGPPGQGPGPGGYGGPPPPDYPPQGGHGGLGAHGPPPSRSYGRQPLPPQENFAPQRFNDSHGPRDHGQHGQQGNRQGNGYSDRGPPQQYDRNFAPPPPPPSHGQGAYSQGGPPMPPPPIRDQHRQQDRRERSPIRRGPNNDRASRREYTKIDRDGRPVEVRLQLERPCRTLFVRNVSYEADSTMLRERFEQFGQIKTYFDIVKNRGMVFITYYDLRHAEEARRVMHATVLNNREMDVHYSLPRGDDRTKDPDRDSNQGTLLITLHGQPNLAEPDLAGLAGRYGDIKAIRHARYPEQKVLEYFDSRGAVMLYDEMHQRPFMGGTINIGFLWDELDQQPINAAKGNSKLISSNPGQIPPSLEPSARRPPPHGQGARPNDMPPPPPNRRDDGRLYNDARGSGGGRYDSAPPNDYGRRDSGNFNAPPPGRYDPAPPRPPADNMHQEADRLEQARKVQSLLSSLGSGGVGAAPAPSGPPPAMGGGGYNADPRRTSYDYPTPSTTNLPPPPAGNPAGIPPEVLSLLNANNVSGMGGHGQGFADAYRPPSAQSQGAGMGQSYGAGADPRLSPITRPNYPPSNVSLSPARSTAPAGGIPGLPPKPANTQAPAEPPQANAASTDVGSLLAMLR